MTDGLAVLAAVLLVVVCAYVWRRWGWPAVVAVVSGSIALLAVAWRRERLPEGPVVVGDPAAPHRERAAAALRDAERAREAAVRIAADIDTAGDAEALVEHLTRRSEEG